MRPKPAQLRASAVASILVALRDPEGLSRWAARATAQLSRPTNGAKYRRLADLWRGDTAQTRRTKRCRLKSIALF